jgi:hypothetical protein
MRYLDRSDSQERFDGAPLVHGSVGFDDAVEIGGEIEYSPRVDAAFENVVKQFGDVSPHGRYATAQSDVAENNRVDRHLHAVWGTNRTDNRADSGNAERRGHGLSRADARSFSLSSRFDAAVCLYDSLNHLMRAADLAAAFGNVRAALRRGGPFLSDFNMQAGFEARWRGSFGLAGDDHALIYRSSWDGASRLGRAAITMFRLQQDVWRRTDLTLHQRCYAEEEITAALRRAGFTDLAVFDAAGDFGLQAEVGRSFFFGPCALNAESARHPRSTG